MGYQVRFLDIAQREHFIFAINRDRNHLAVYCLDDTLPLPAVLHRHPQYQRHFLIQKTGVMFSDKQGRSIPGEETSR